jgi:nitrogenase subunit NifH
MSCSDCKCGQGKKNIAAEAQFIEKALSDNCKAIDALLVRAYDEGGKILCRGFAMKIAERYGNYCYMLCCRDKEDLDWLIKQQGDGL